MAITERELRGRYGRRTRTAPSQTWDQWADGVMPRKIITTHYPEAAKATSIAWTARFEGRQGGPYGFGKTEAEAIDDLADNHENPDQE
jgi:hypothetical protein